ncbi:TPA: hypothetical protein RQJ64_004388 [Vibrio vulnificus]|nr:hypothetical protein [Vibrio vulnificus]HDY7507399.1 hypothetical protein [Vibrio vulnificus]
MELIQILPSFLIGLLTGSLSLYFTAYLKEKGKSRALLEELRNLEDQKQKIISKYQKEVEDVKKTHQLDIEKRKHRYESKKTQYYQFMEEVDEFNGCLARVLAGEFSQIMMEFYGFTHNVSGLSKNELTVKFNNLAQEAVTNIKGQQIKLYSRLNAFKLSANDEIGSLLENMLHEIQKSENNLVRILTYIGSPEFQISRNVPEEILRISDSNKSNLANVKQKLMTALKHDLDAI